MRLFTNISFLTALLAIFGSSVTAAIAVLAFGCSRFILAFIIPVSCLCYFLSLLIAHFIAQPLTELAQKRAPTAKATRASCSNLQVRCTKLTSCLKISAS